MASFPALNRLLAVAAVVALLLLPSLVFAGCAAGEEADETTTSTGSETSVTEAPAATTTTPEADGTTTTAQNEDADVAVAVDVGGRVIVLDAQTGEEIRILFDGVRVDDPAKNDVSVTPDHATAYVVRPGPPGEGSTASEIVAVPVSGERDAELVTEGVAPAVSPDGGTLAYVALEETDRFFEPVLVLRNLDTEEETRLTRSEPFFAIGDVAWTTDGSEVVFTAGEIALGLYVVQATATSLDEARRIGPTARGQDVSWPSATPFGEDRLAVIESRGDPPGSEGSIIIAVNVPEQTVEGGLLPVEAIDATRVDSDPGGEELLIVVVERPGEGRLLRWRGGTENPELLAPGIVTAAW